ncbi:exodeoxyribonuclease V subunit beta [Endozoicomonadaceae bacterium StTr2]
MSTPKENSAPEIQAFPLKPLSFPLHGRRLIEASAGTGKTFTIASLYLRLVLGHGPLVDGLSTAYSEPLSVDKILVVTFTEAATAELRERIRARLHEARLAFLRGKSDDSIIQELLDSLDQHPERARLLLAAERQMDEASIFTIHGFCQRMLRQHAFESGTLFTSELVTDESELLQQAAADFWRKHLYSLPRPLTELVLEIWSSPEELLRSIRSWLGLTGLDTTVEGLPESLDDFRNRHLKPVLELKQLWLKDREIIEKAIQGAGLRAKCKPLTRLELMRDFVKSDDISLYLGGTKSKPESWEIYSTQSLQKALKKNASLPEHPIFSKIDNYLQQPLSLKKAFSALLQHQALHFVRQRLAQAKDQRRLISFDDLLSKLDKALQQPNGELLGLKIREQFPVAMIDEFQDTDPQQYNIFSHIYPASDNSENNSTDSLLTGLFMIGDPKQAIYAFRGADIFTYMKARHEVDAHYTLSTNWRSSSNMVNAVNHLFTTAASPFIYDSDIPFLAVDSAPGADTKYLTLDDQPLPAMQFWLQPSEIAVGKGEYEDTMALATANEINRLLTAADQGHCHVAAGGQSKPLLAGDIAVLVRTGAQGKKVRDALADQGIASVYLSNSDSVFATQEAVDLQRILAACLTPTSERALRAALATPLLDESAFSLDQLNSNERAWEQAVEEFSHYNEVWNKRGVLPMLRTVMARRKIAERLLPQPFGDRRLTDLLHLGELLATASAGLDSHHALLRWLQEHTSEPNTNAEEQQLHLESDRNLVQIITIHKSKGLEFNAVFLPFACTWRQSKEALFHDDTGQPVLDLTASSTAVSKADRERLAEDLRLLYVALTRPVHTCYVGIAPVKGGPGKKGPKTDLPLSAFGWLLNGGQEITAPGLTEKMGALSEHPAITCTRPPVQSGAPYQQPASPEQELQAKSFTGRIQRDWWVTSYSALSRNAHSAGNPDASLEIARLDIEVSQETAATTADEKTIFSFPRGAAPGTFLHSLFEQLDGQEGRPDFTSAHEPALSPFVQDQLTSSGISEEWTEVLVQLLHDVLDAPLDDQELSLRKLSSKDCKVEMSFFLPLGKLSAPDLNRTIQAEDPLSARCGALDFRQVQGMLKGFIDLTFVHNGRWYVLDYKSNHLGDAIENYHPAALEQAMCDHRYDLQYQIYSLALHRLLQSRLPDYDYEKHFGGVYYLFLRGMKAGDSNKPGVFYHRPAITLIEKLDLLFKGNPDD